HVNLIPYNPIDSAPELHATQTGDIRAFAAALRARGFTVTIRHSLGADIAAACGQLACRAVTANQAKSVDCAARPPLDPCTPALPAPVTRENPTLRGSGPLFACQRAPPAKRRDPSCPSIRRNPPPTATGSFGSNRRRLLEPTSLRPPMRLMPWSKGIAAGE